MPEPIIINDVDVSKCAYLNPLNEYECLLYASSTSEPFCEGVNCYFKQKERYWKQLQQEEEKNARLTKQLKEYKEEVRRLRNYR